MNKRIIALLLIGTLFVSCRNQQEELLCKTWEVVDVQFINEDQSLVQSDTLQGNMLEVRKNTLREILLKNIYTFNDDGSFRTGNAAGETEGQWELRNKTIRFMLVSGDKKKDKEIPVALLTKDSLVLTMKNDQTSLQVKLILTPMTEQP